MSDLKPSNKFKKIVALIKRLSTHSLRNIPFSSVIKELTGHEIVKLSSISPKIQMRICVTLKKVGAAVIDELKKNPPEFDRPNELSNFIERKLIEIIQREGGTAERPANKSRRKQASGYPDLVVTIDGLRFYLECKILSEKSNSSTQRSFYFSPTANIKITDNLPHMLIAFTYDKLSTNSRSFVLKHCEIISLEDLRVDLKLEFSSDNKRLYSKNKVKA